MSDNNELINNKKVININDLKLLRDSMILILSSRKTGKSYLLADLIYYFLTNKENKCDYVYLFSHTAYLNSAKITNSQFNFIDSKAIIPAEYINDVVSQLMITQQQTNFKNHILLVFDDISLNPHEYPILNDLAVRGRHYFISAILSSQIANNMISPSIRSNCSYIFWRRLTRKSLELNIYPSVMGFENVKELIKFTENNIRDFQFIFYNNNKDYDNHSIQIVKAVNVPDNFQYIVKYDDDTDKKNKKNKKIDQSYKYYGQSLYDDNYNKYDYSKFI